MPDTIVAISSPPVVLSGASSGSQAGMLPVCMVRLSGPVAAACADAVFKIKLPEAFVPTTSTIPMRAKTSKRALPASLVEAIAEKNWRRIAGSVRWSGHELDAHAYVMRGPRSYTREDVVELHVPGLPWLVEEILNALTSAGARLAQPGEFTRRAFENGRITLEQAEAVGRLIAASSADEARAHAAQLAAHVGVQRRALKKDLEDLLAQVELGLDFAHEDVVVISLEEMAERLEKLRVRALKLAEDSARETERNAARGAPRIVLAGPTNAGKSRLFNALLKRDAAIVSAQRHTTRDAVEAPISFDGSKSSAMLIDSAGSGDQGIEDAELFSAARSVVHRELATADILLLVLDRSVALNEQEGLVESMPVFLKLKPAGAAIVWTKSDLPAAPKWSADAAIEFTASKRFEVSAQTGAGVAALNAFLAHSTAELSVRTAEAHAAAGASIRACATTAAEALERAAEALRDGCGEDVVAVELREAIHAFWQAEGVIMRHDAVTEAALDIIFSQFCIGK